MIEWFAHDHTGSFVIGFVRELVTPLDGERHFCGKKLAGVRE